MKSEFLISRQGSQFVLFAGLLDLAHTKGLREIDTELISVEPVTVKVKGKDVEGLRAICKARVTMVSQDGAERHFSGIGDADPSNVGPSIAVHTVRMAETRSKARALRDALNIGVTALEELSDDDEAPAKTRRTQHEKAAEDAANLPTKSETVATSGTASKSQRARLKWMVGQTGEELSEWEAKYGAIDSLAPERAEEWLSYYKEQGVGGG
jgi:hypothetical protein